MERPLFHTRTHRHRTIGDLVTTPFPGPALSFSIASSLSIDRGKLIGNMWPLAVRLSPWHLPTEMPRFSDIRTRKSRWKGFYWRKWILHRCSWRNWPTGTLVLILQSPRCNERLAAQSTASRSTCTYEIRDLERRVFPCDVVARLQLVSSVIDTGFLGNSGSIGWFIQRSIF